jgi:hypothetical protein
MATVFYDGTHIIQIDFVQLDAVFVFVSLVKKDATSFSRVEVEADNLFLGLLVFISPHRQHKNQYVQVY